MTRNLQSLTRNLTTLNRTFKKNPSLKTSGVKVLRNLGVIKPQQRSGVASHLRKLLK